MPHTALSAHSPLPRDRAELDRLVAVWRWRGGQVIVVPEPLKRKTNEWLQRNAAEQFFRKINSQRYQRSLAQRACTIDDL